MGQCNDRGIGFDKLGFGAGSYQKTPNVFARRVVLEFIAYIESGGIFLEIHGKQIGTAFCARVADVENE